jgi:GPI mannosyltransferase 3
MNISDGKICLTVGKSGCDKMNQSRSNIESISYSELHEDVNCEHIREVAPIEKMVEQSSGPRPARFNTFIRRQLPKSSEEKEAELVEYYRQHPFRANPILFEFDPRPDSQLRRPLPKSTKEKEEELMEYYRQHPIRAKPIRFQLHSELDGDSSNDTDNDPDTQFMISTSTQQSPFHCRSRDRVSRNDPDHEFDPRPDSHLRRPLPKSTQEKEEELMEYYRQHPIRAKPIRFQRHPELEVDSSNDDDNDPDSQFMRSTSTQQTPFCCRSKDRTSRNDHDRGTNIDSIFRKLSSADTDVRRSETAPQPSHLHVNERIQKGSGCTINQQQDEKTDRQTEQFGTNRRNDMKPFQLASVTRQQTNLALKNQQQKDEEEKLNQTLHQFRPLDGDRQTNENDENSRKYSDYNNKRVYNQTVENDESIILHKKWSAPRRKNKIRLNSGLPGVLVDTTHNTPQSIEVIYTEGNLSKKLPNNKQQSQPFELASVARHQIYQKQFEDKIRQQESEQKKLAEFRALEWNPQLFEYHHDKQKYLQCKKRAYPPNSVNFEKSLKVHTFSERCRSNTTSTEPFGLHSIKRHQSYQREFYKKIKNEKRWNQPPLSSYIRPTSYWTSILKLASSGTNRTTPRSTKKSSSRKFSSPPSPVTHRAPPSGETTQPETAANGQLRNFERKSNVSAYIDPSLATSATLASFEENTRPTRLGRVNVSIFYMMFLFLLLSTFRVFNTFVVQTYFDPDEFWQTMEPAYCHVFSRNVSKCPGFTWEWERRAPDAQALNIIEASMLGPVRTYLSIVPVYLYYWVTKRFQIDTLWSISRGPMILNAITVAAPVDLLTWYCATWLLPRNGSPHQNSTLALWCLFCSLTSWFNGYTLVRTFANGQETLLLILALACISPEFIGNIDRKYYTTRTCICFLLGGLAVSIRFTAIAAFIPIGIILAMRCKSALSAIGFLFGTCATFGISGIGIAATVDRHFYGFWTIPFLGNFHFNAILNFADLYGSHPSHWYLTAGLPALTGALLPFVVYDFYQFSVARNSSNGRRNLWVVIICYVAVMSFNAHKEFRFILPILPLICIICGNHIGSVFRGNNKEKSTKVRTSILISIFVGANFIALLFLGLFHQLGPVAVNRSIAEYSKILYESNPQRFKNVSIHYLTGACHSTPLLSHLHIPAVNFEDNMWHLDCSPDCRSDPKRKCEYERFDSDPLKFLQDKYFPCSTSSRLFYNTCLASLSDSPRPIPDFIVTLARYSNQVKQALSTERFEEIARYPLQINGIRLPHLEDPNINANNVDPMNDFRKITFLYDTVKVSFEDVVLLSRHEGLFGQCQAATCPN